MQDRIEFLVKEITSLRHNIKEVSALPKNKRTKKFKRSCKLELDQSLIALGRLVDDETTDVSDALDSGLEYMKGRENE